MLNIESLVLYVENIETSKKFYTEIFKCDVEVLSATYIAFQVAPNFSISLKQRAQAEPAASVTGGGTELSVLVSNTKELNDLFKQWKNKGVNFLQPVTELVFGHTFVALDPDEHRIRVFAKDQS